MIRLSASCHFVEDDDYLKDGCTGILLLRRFIGNVLDIFFCGHIVDKLIEHGKNSNSKFSPNTANRTAETQPNQSYKKCFK